MSAISGRSAAPDGEVEIQIRDLDQTVIGNPAHDLIRLGLSLASAARGADLPGVTTAHMIEQMIEGYESAFDPSGIDDERRPEAVHLGMKEAARRSWRHLARERLEDIKPSLPFGKTFWPISQAEGADIEAVFASEAMRRLATQLRARRDDAPVEICDAGYWVKGCSSLGLLRLRRLAAHRRLRRQGPRPLPDGCEGGCGRGGAA